MMSIDGPTIWERCEMRNRPHTTWLSSPAAIFARHRMALLGVNDDMCACVDVGQRSLSLRGWAGPWTISSAHNVYTTQRGATLHDGASEMLRPLGRQGMGATMRMGDIEVHARALRLCNAMERNGEALATSQGPPT